MSDDILHQVPTGPATEQAEVGQPSAPAVAGTAEGTGASEQQQAVLAEQQAAEQRIEERRIRQERARRNQEAAFRRLSAEKDQLQSALLEVVRKQAGGQQEQGQTRPSDGAPKREDFSSWEDYEDARIDWRAARKAQELAERNERELAQRLQNASRQAYDQQITQAHNERNAQFAAAVPDFADVTDRDDVIVPDVAAEAIKNVPNGPEILYAIGRDPSIAARMHSMTPAQQAAYVGQMSASLMFRQPQVSQAPAPGKPVGGQSSPVTDPAKMSYEEFVKYRRRQIAARR